MDVGWGTHRQKERINEMFKYIVKQVSVATEENKNFRGMVSIGYYGKDQKLIGHYGSFAKEMHDEMELTNYAIKEFGYDRLCDAKRSWIYKNPENTKYWQSTVEICCEVVG